MSFFRSKIFVALIVIALGAFGFFIWKISSKKVEGPPAEVKKVWPVKEIIGKSVQGRAIESYTYGEGENHLVFVGGIHGGYEWNGVLLAYSLMDYLDENKDGLNKNLKVTVIPSLNPDGVYKVVGKEGRFSAKDVSTDKTILASARFNANNVDLNRNFDCNWKPESTWQSRKVSAGKSVFSEPEAKALRDYAISNKPEAFVFYHSQANAVYASACNDGILPETLSILSAYSKATGYKQEKSFDNYEITGDAGDYLASIKIPAISIELKTHEAIEWDKNLKGIKALFEYYSGSE